MKLPAAVLLVEGHVLGEAVGEVDADTDVEAGEDMDAATAWAPEGWYAPSEA